MLFSAVWSLGMGRKQKSTAVVLHVREWRPCEVIVWPIFHLVASVLPTHTHAGSSLFELEVRALQIDMQQGWAGNRISLMWRYMLYVQPLCMITSIHRHKHAHTFVTSRHLPIVFDIISLFYKPQIIVRCNFCYFPKNCSLTFLLHVMSDHKHKHTWNALFSIITVHMTMWFAVLQVYFSISSDMSWTRQETDSQRSKQRFCVTNVKLYRLFSFKIFN